VRILSFTTPVTNSSGLVDFEWAKAGDKLPFEMKVQLDDDGAGIIPEVWTNANHNADPDRFDPIAMREVRRDGNQVTYRADVPIDKIGNYKAIGRVRTAGDVRWMGDDGISDVRFRPRDEAHDALNIEIVNVGMANFDPRTRQYGTFADMMGTGSPATDGKYTLAYLAAQGVTGLWLQPIFEIEKWDHRPQSDDAGSPYAVKDYFTPRFELCKTSHGLTGEPARQAAIAEVKAFIQQAESLGIRVLLDVALNHVGHNYQFRDLFKKPDGTREVRANDFSQVAVDEAQLRTIERRLADPQITKTMERLAPHVYGKWGDSNGASKVEEIAPGGWFEWPDTKQLNHGRSRHGYHWTDDLPSAAQLKVQDWLTRVLEFWAVDVGVHGFRLDHLTGLPERFLDHGLNKVQAEVDRLRPGKRLFILGEDFHTNAVTRHWLDAGQGGWFHELRRVRNPQHLEWVIEHPWFKDLLALGSHDEARFIHDFGDDPGGASRMLALMQLLGGPSASVIGDARGEWQQLAFKQYAGVPALRSSDAAADTMATIKRRAGLAKLRSPALKDSNRRWLKPNDGSTDTSLFAITRFADDKQAPLVFIAGNFADHQRSNLFRLDDDARARIDPTKRYQVTDAMNDDPRATLWPSPKTGREILEQGLYVSLAADQVQALTLRAVG
jgi:hypothetical protein